MKIEFDAAKSEWNARERGLPFDRAKDFDYDTALVELDKRRDYGEVRVNAIGYMRGTLHMLCFKPIAPHGIRVISLRRASTKERRKYEKEKAAIY